MASIFDIFKIFRPRKTILSDDFNSLQASLKAAFDGLGTQAPSGKQGVGSSFYCAEPTEDGHAVNRGYLDNYVPGTVLDSGTADGQSIRWDSVQGKYSPTNNIVVDSTGLSTWIGGNDIEGIQVYGIGQGKTFIAASEKDDAIGDATKELNIAATSIDVTVDDSFRVKAGGDFNFVVSDNGKTSVGEYINVGAMLGVKNTGGMEGCFGVKSSDSSNKFLVREDGGVGINNAGVTGRPLTVKTTDGESIVLSIRDEGSVGINNAGAAGYPLLVYKSDLATKRLEITDEGEVAINGNHVNGVVFLVYDATGSNKLFQVGNGGDVYMPEVYDNTTTLKPNVHMDPNGRLFRSTNTWS